MKYVFITLLALCVSACSDNFNETDRENIVELKRDVKELREIVSAMVGNGSSSAQSSDLSLGSQPPKLISNGPHVYHSGVDEALDSIVALKGAEVVRIFAVTKPDDETKQIRIELVSSTNHPIFSFIATNYDGMLDHLIKNNMFISVKWRLLLTDEYNNPEDIAFKKALVAIFKDHEYHRELSLKRIKKMNSDLDSTMRDATRWLEQQNAKDKK
jgi:hypothetical protein